MQCLSYGKPPKRGCTHQRWDFSKRTRPGKIDPYRHPPVTCGPNKLYSMRSGHHFGNLFDRRAKPGEGSPRAQTLKPWVSQGLSTWAGEDWTRRTVRRKPPSDSTGRKAIPSHALWNAQSVTRCIGRHGHPLHLISGVYRVCRKRERTELLAPLDRVVAVTVIPLP